ncbi:unnamed protein product [Caenorhabditis sp. 36 PRJEB53466]|nr:unnamed protein product [Caenorhabditis sp. 36 PRJEB53466]
MATIGYLRKSLNSHEVDQFKSLPHEEKLRRLNNFFIHGSIRFTRIIKLLSRRCSKKELVGFLAGVNGLLCEEDLFVVYLIVKNKNLVDQMSDEHKTALMDMFDGQGNLKTCAKMNDPDGQCECEGAWRSRYRSEIEAELLLEQRRQQARMLPPPAQFLPMMPPFAPPPPVAPFIPMGYPFAPPMATAPGFPIFPQLPPPHVMQNLWFHYPPQQQAHQQVQNMMGGMLQNYPNQNN